LAGRAVELLVVQRRVRSADVGASGETRVGLAAARTARPAASELVATRSAAASAKPRPVMSCGRVKRQAVRIRRAPRGALPLGPPLQTCRPLPTASAALVERAAIGGEHDPHLLLLSTTADPTRWSRSGEGWAVGPSHSDAQRPSGERRNRDHARQGAGPLHFTTGEAPDPAPPRACPDQPTAEAPLNQATLRPDLGPHRVRRTSTSRYRSPTALHNNRPRPDRVGASRLGANERSNDGAAPG
jgi:hypothetical protein